jgi:hypothetical protein
VAGRGRSRGEAEEAGGKGSLKAGIRKKEGGEWSDG